MFLHEKDSKCRFNRFVITLPDSWEGLEASVSNSVFSLAVLPPAAPSEFYGMTLVCQLLLAIIFLERTSYVSVEVPQLSEVGTSYITQHLQPGTNGRAHRYFSSCQPEVVFLHPYFRTIGNVISGP